MVLKVDVHVFELVRLAVLDCWRQLYWKECVLNCSDRCGHIHFDSNVIQLMLLLWHQRLPVHVEMRK